MRKSLAFWLAVGAVALLAEPAAASSLLPTVIRGWAFPYNLSFSNSSRVLPTSALYPPGTVNFLPTGGFKANEVPAMRSYGITPLGWAYCWNSPYVPSHNGSKIENASAAIGYFKSQALCAKCAPGVPGVGLDECNNGNGRYDGVKELAAAGFRQAKKSKPEVVIAGWGANDDDEVYTSLMADGTFDLAMIEGYTYCPGCGDWPNSTNCCATGGIEPYFGHVRAR